MNQSKCDLAYELANHPIYRISTFYTFSVSMIAAPSLMYLLVERILPLHFHGNLKTLLISYFMSLFLFAVVLCLDFGYQFFVPMIVSSNCSLIINKTLYEFVHVPSLLFLTTPMMFPLGFSIERFIATGMARRYDKIPTCLGPILVGCVVAPNFFVFCYIFWNETFNDVFISFLMIPATSVKQFDNYFWYLLYLQFGNLLCNVALLIFHNRFNKRYLLRENSLSTRYAMEEISQSSKFTLTITFTHLLFFGIYLICSVIVRELDPFFGSFVNVVRGIHFTIPTYNFVIVLITFESFRYLTSERATKVRNAVDLKATGHEGAKNYQMAIMNQWATKVSGKI